MKLIIWVLHNTEEMMIAIFILVWYLRTENQFRLEMDADLRGIQGYFYSTYQTATASDPWIQAMKSIDSIRFLVRLLHQRDLRRKKRFNHI